MNFLFALAMTLLPPCAQEDSNNCYWDAAHMGNGVGRSYITLNDRPIFFADNRDELFTLVEIDAAGDAEAIDYNLTAEDCVDALYAGQVYGYCEVQS